MLATESARHYILRSNSNPGKLGGLGMGSGNTRGGNVSLTTEQQMVSPQVEVFPTPESAEPRVWRTGAACRDTTPDLFFPVGQTGPAIQHIKDAKAVCDTCAVAVECLEYALMTNQDAGIWGGLTEDERRKIRRERRREARAAAKRA